MPRTAPSIAMLLLGLGSALRFQRSALTRTTQQRWLGWASATRLFSTTEGPDGDAYSNPNRPPTLPSGAFRPKQSLGQNYLSDQNYCVKMTDTLKCDSEHGQRVVELGPGLGALTRLLVEAYPEMLAIEIDERAVNLLRERYPLTVLHSDVLAVDFTAVAALRGGPLSVIGNLPYYITSQILFSLVDHRKSVRRACVTMQLEVAQRLVALPRSKEYGILSVVFQLYARPRIAFKIPPSAFYPAPKVTSAFVTIDFPEVNLGVDSRKLRTVVKTAFSQRRKMMRQSLKGILPPGVELDDMWAKRRPEELAPLQFIELTKSIFGSSEEEEDAPVAGVWAKQKKTARQPKFAAPQEQEGPYWPTEEQ